MAPHDIDCTVTIISFLFLSPLLLFYLLTHYGCQQPFLVGNLKRAVEAEVMLNCNTNVIPRLSGGGKGQLLQAEATAKAECVNLTKSEAGLVEERI